MFLLFNSGMGGGGYPLSGAIHPCIAPDNELDEMSNSLLNRTTSIHGRFAEIKNRREALEGLPEKPL